MLDQAQVDAWLDQFLAGLRERFGDRLVFVGHHGSWARGEAGPESDIDAFVILDEIGDADLESYRELIASMPDAAARASTFLGSVMELRQWPRHEQTQCRRGCKVLHGTLDGIVESATDEDLREDVRLKATANLHLARHYLLHPHDMQRVGPKLRYPFKECFYALQSWMLLTTGTYYARKLDLLAALSDADDKEVVGVARDWHRLSDDWMERPRHYVRLLERWCRGMLARAAAFGGGGDFGGPDGAPSER